MTVWIYREIFEGGPRAIVFGTRKEALAYAKSEGLKRNKGDKWGYDLADDEYSINKEDYFMERAC